MSDAVLGSLIAAVGVIIVALIGLLSSTRASRTQRKGEENERRLSALEDGNEHLITNLRIESDRATARAEVAEARALASEEREATWRRRAITAERRVDEYIQDREKP